MGWPAIKFVDAPEVGATVRLDLNGADAWPDPDSFDLGAPELLGDPEGVGSEYGRRTLSFTWQVLGSKSAALTLQSSLARELQRDTNWLLFQLTSTSAPVWFKTYRTSPGAVSLQGVYVAQASEATPDDVWRVAVALEADPFAYGAEETFTITTPNDPTAAGGLGVALPTIKGDAPAPLTLRSNTVGGNWGHVLVSLSTSAAVYGEPNVTTGYTSSGSAATGVAWMLNGTAARHVISAGVETTLMSTTSAAAIPGGHYHVFLRFKSTVTGPGVTLPITMSTPGTGSQERTVTARLDTITGSSLPILVDLGTITTGPTNGWTSERSRGISVKATPAIGMTVDVDYLILVPVDRYGTWTAHGHTDSSTVRFILDSELEAAARLTNSYPAAPIVKNVDGHYYVPRGGYPEVRPGETNYLWVQVGDEADRADPEDPSMLHVLTTAPVWQGSYRPRHLYLAAS